MRSVFVVLIILSGFLLRLLWLGSIPDGLHVIEASITYDAWSLLHSGVDHNGMTWPLTLTTMDHGAQLAYTYLAIPIVALLGSPWSIRLENMMLALLSLWVFWKLGSNNSNASSKWWPLALLATSPWHFMASRWATPTLIAPSFILLAVYILSIKPVTRFRIMFIITILSTIVVVNQIPYNYIAIRGWEHLPDNAIQVIRLLLGNDNNGQALNVIPFWGAQYIWLTPFVLWGALIAMRDAASDIDKLMLAWFVAALIGACATTVSIDHMNLLWMPSLWLAARGVQQLEHIPAIDTALQVLLAACFVAFCAQYFTSWRAAVAPNFSIGFGAAIEHATAVAHGADISITNDTADSRIYTAAYTHSYPNNDDTRYIIASATPTTTLNDIRYWVASKGELSRFHDLRYSIESFGNFAVISLRDDNELSCTQVMPVEKLTGRQDFGSPGINGEVNTRGSGFQMSGQFFAIGIGAHGNSDWSTALEHSAQAIEVGMGQSDNSTCSDGAIFKLFADGKLVFKSARLQVGDLQFSRIPLNNAKTLQFVTDAGPHSMCSHNNWIRAIVTYCASATNTVLK